MQDAGQPRRRRRLPVDKLIDIWYIVSGLILVIYGIIILIITDWKNKNENNIMIWIIVNNIRLAYEAFSSYYYYYLNRNHGIFSKVIGTISFISYLILQFYAIYLLNHKVFFKDGPEYTYIEINLILFLIWSEFMMVFIIISIIYYCAERCLGYLIINRIMNGRHPIIIFFPNLRHLYRRLNDVQIQQLPTYEFIPDLEEEANSCDELCAICLTSYEVTERIIKLPCNHIFHQECGVEWLKVNASCPMCRKSILP